MAYPNKNGYKSNSDEKAVEKYKNYQWGTIAVTVQPRKKEMTSDDYYQVINLYNVDPDSAKAIIERLNDKTKNRATSSAWIDRTEPTHVLIKVRCNRINDWLDGGDLNALQAVLIKSGKYNADEVMHFEDEIATGFYSKDKEIIGQTHKDAEENSMEMWQNYLSKINDPVTLAQIKLYSRIYRDRTYGHVLSVKNAMLIKAYDKDATFVTTATNWRNLFGRGVKRGAKPLPYYGYWSNNKGTPSAQELEAVKDENGWEDVDFSKLSVQVRNDLIMRANKKGGICVRQVGYDVKDTYLLSGAKEDIWTSQIGLLNNLNGELNQAALQHKQEVQKEKPNVEGSDEMMARTEKACSWMEQFCQQNGYKTETSYQDASNKLADYLLNYCAVNATKKANILSEKNITTYAENATQVTLILTNLGWNALSRFHRTYEYSKPEAKALMSVVFGIAKQLEENSVITEGIFSWLRDKATFIKMFLKALRQIGCTVVDKPIQQPVQQQVPVQNAQNIEEVRNNFTELFNRINQNYFYDDNNKRI